MVGMPAPAVPAPRPRPAGMLPGRPVAPRVTTAPLPSLRYWRLQRALLQDELAARAGLTQSTIWRLEAGRPATIRTMRRLAAALDIEAAELMQPPPE
jgi:DNA-binding XRE family transcriptional regulator